MFVAITNIRDKTKDIEISLITNSSCFHKCEIKKTTKIKSDNIDIVKKFNNLFLSTITHSFSFFPWR